MKCLICENNDIKYFDDYKYNVKFDARYFKDPKILSKWTNLNQILLIKHSDLMR